MSRPQILFYCQHLLGLGHVQRAALLARALVKGGEPVLFVSGGPPVPGLDLGGAEEVALPPLTAADDAASGLALPDGRPPDARYLAERRMRLTEIVARADPGLVLLELFPFGRHALAFELVPLLLALADDRRRRGPGAPRVAVSLRDILVSKKNQPWYELTVLAVVRQWIDRVLVHGSPEVIPLSRTFGLADRLGDTLVYTGYLAQAPPGSPGSAPRGEVVVSGGGGRVAGPLFRTALAARALSPAAAALPWRLITGPYLPAATRAELEGLTTRFAPVADRPAVVLETFRDDFPALLRAAALSLSQAGYNTVLDIVASGARAVVVPYEGSGDEQPLRARLLAERGLLAVVPEAELSPARLAAAMDAALATPGFPAPARLDLDGAARSVAILRELVDGVIAARRRWSPGPLLPKTSRLDSHIRQKIAQREAINLAARWLAGEHGFIVEFGLGNGRSYSHLVERFPRHEVFCFDRRDVAHPGSRPPADHLYLGEFAGVLEDPALHEQFTGRVVLLHLDLGSGGPEDETVPEVVLERTHRWLTPGAVVLSDQELTLAPAWRLARVDTTREAQETDRYYVYRRRADDPRPEQR